ncbi:LysR family transcriptional regulator [Vogesella sp. LIG4]|uniref:LysR family transcriptional regulator n=1 Tax=Vogesella sp. LIG4 TaxID=1192162 RepID=UPI0008201374|nr:LysR substrate-binding domain-containing protein [Vogesella sp. LIG4]SCK05495.1 DNA-binding transcriptional regulator, LysR family [Vogesella sp. LIG4]
MNGNDLQLDWLRAFVTVVDSGSLTAASRQLYRSQSAISMQLKKLEDAAGRPLLARGPRHLVLTVAGSELLPHARRLLAVHAEAVAALHAPAVSGRIRLGVPDDYAMAYMAPVLRTFSSRYPGVEITLVCEQSTVLIPRVERGELDLALVSRDQPQRGELLFREALLWVGAEEHEAWRREPLPIAVHELGSRARSEVLAAIDAQQRAYRIVYYSPNVAGQLAAAYSGMAVAVLTRCSLPPDLKVLDARHGLPPLPELEVALIRSAASARAPAVDAMHEQLLRTLQREGIS